jgi:hypothetical protein
MASEAISQQFSTKSLLGFLLFVFGSFGNFQARIWQALGTRSEAAGSAARCLVDAMQAA